MKQNTDTELCLCVAHSRTNILQTIGTNCNMINIRYEYGTTRLFIKVDPQYYTSKKPYTRIIEYPNNINITMRPIAIP